jgi:hypothetical protein
MNLRSVIPMAVLFALPLSGCIIVSDKTDGTAGLVWTFPANSISQNPTCSEAGVTTVKVSIDSGDWISFACEDGQTLSGVSTPRLSRGSHSILLSAVNSMGYEYYSKSSSLPISGTSTLQQYDLDWAVGGATVHWLLADGSTLTCSQAGVSDVYVNFRDSTGAFVYADSGDKEPCSASAIVYSFIKPGTYSVFVQATDTASHLYQSSTTNPPSITVRAGVFTSMSDGPNLVMNRVP